MALKKKITIGGETIELPAGFSLKWLLWGFIALMLIIILSGTFYQINPEENGMILRFGQFVRTTNPGLHMKIPLGVEQLIKVPIQRQLKMEFGFRTVTPGVRTQYRTTPETVRESIMLTGDLNVADVEWIVQYKIKDAYQYLFKIRDAPATFRYMTEAVVRELVGDYSVDEVITISRGHIAIEAQNELQKLCDLYEIGIHVDQLIFQNVNPPEPVKPAFNEVNQSIQEKERKINEAFAEYNSVVPRAEGEALQMISAAEGYAMERINNAEGDAARFSEIYNEYRRAPEVTRKRMYLETMHKIFPKINKKFIMDEKQSNVLPLLDLGREVK